MPRRIKRSGGGKKITRKPAAGVKTETAVKTKPAPKPMKPDPAPRVDFSVFRDSMDSLRAEAEEAVTSARLALSRLEDQFNALIEDTVSRLSVDQVELVKALEDYRNLQEAVGLLTSEVQELRIEVSELPTRHYKVGIGHDDVNAVALLVMHEIAGEDPAIVKPLRRALRRLEEDGIEVRVADFAEGFASLSARVVMDGWRSPSSLERWFESPLLPAGEERIWNNRRLTRAASRFVDALIEKVFQVCFSMEAPSWSDDLRGILVDAFIGSVSSVIEEEIPEPYITEKEPEEETPDPLKEGAEDFEYVSAEADRTTTHADGELSVDVGSLEAHLLQDEDRDLVLWRAEDSPESNPADEIEENVETETEAASAPTEYVKYRVWSSDPGGSKRKAFGIDIEGPLMQEDPGDEVRGQVKAARDWSRSNPDWSVELVFNLNRRVYIFGVGPCGSLKSSDKINEEVALVVADIAGDSHSLQFRDEDGKVVQYG